MNPAGFQDDRKGTFVTFHRQHFLSGFFLNFLNCSPPFQVGVEQCKVDNIRGDTDHAEVSQNKCENGCKIERTGHWNPGGEDQKRCCFFRHRQSCKEKSQIERISGPQSNIVHYWEISHSLMSSGVNILLHIHIMQSSNTWNTCACHGSQTHWLANDILNKKLSAMQCNLQKTITD